MRPAIYIGIGGTGIRIISQTKKMFEDIYGEGNIPGCIAFMAIDFNVRDIDSPDLATPMGTDAIRIPYIGSPREHYETLSKTDAFKWMFEGNTGGLQDCTGMVRTTGRFYTEYIMASIEPAMQRCWQQVTNITNNDTPIDVHIAMSLVGGTGGGAFINIAEIIGRLYGRHAHIIGYGVLHGVFRAMDPTGMQVRRVRENAYSAIMDLDYLMSAEINNPVTFEINGATRTLTQPIFHEFFVIDNTTANGIIVPTVNALCEAIGTNLYVNNNIIGHSLGEVNGHWREGFYDVLNKKGWVQSLGGCQVVYKGELMAEIYAKKFAVELIRKMLKESADAQHSASVWAETAKVCDIEEEFRMHISYPPIRFEDTCDNTKTIIRSYLNSLAEFPTVETINRLKRRKEELLYDRIDNLINSELRVNDTKNFLITWIRLFKNFQTEAEERTIYLEEEIRCRYHKLECTFREYEHLRNSNFHIFRRRSCQERLDMIGNISRTILDTKYEISRLRAAINILESLINVANIHLERVERLIEKFEKLCHTSYEDVYRLQNQSCHTHVFEYDLSTRERSNMQIDTEDVNLAAFNATLTKSLLEVDINELGAIIYDFAKSRPQAGMYRTKRLIDVINSLSHEDFDALMTAIHEMSSPLLSINDRRQRCQGGRTPSESMVTEYQFLLNCNNDELHRLNYYNMQNITVNAAGCQFVQLRQKMYVLRADHAVIPYCIHSLDETVKGCYDTMVSKAVGRQGGFNPHFDKVLFDEMRVKNFKLEPE